MSAAHGETHEFRAEIRKLLDIITHSIYTNREIFVRELVSNASDALDKLRFEQSRGTTVADPDEPLEIRITTDKDAGRITIADTGCGMTRDELIDHLGTIAKSGTEAFMRSVADNKDAASNLIGRFGVGFYSVFMVADQVAVTSRSFVPDAAPAAGCPTVRAASPWRTSTEKRRAVPPSRSRSKRTPRNTPIPSV